MTPSCRWISCDGRRLRSLHLGVLGDQLWLIGNAGPPDLAADAGNAEVDDGGARGHVLHGLQLLASGGEGGFDGGDFAEPALLFGFGEPVDEVGLDLFESGLLSWVNA